MTFRSSSTFGNEQMVIIIAARQANFGMEVASMISVEQRDRKIVGDIDT